jgi:NTP pyrophosphatase (non-canonical NTP hydrolase)
MTHSELVTALVKSPEEIRNKLTLGRVNLLHMILGISGEAGELLDQIKKHTIYNKPLDRENVVEELGDLEFYMEGLRQELEITREETISHNIEKLSVRYGQLQYRDEDAIARVDKS